MRDASRGGFAVRWSTGAIVGTLDFVPISVCLDAPATMGRIAGSGMSINGPRSGRLRWLRESIRATIDFSCKGRPAEELEADILGGGRDVPIRLHEVAHNPADVHQSVGKEHQGLCEQHFRQPRIGMRCRCNARVNQRLSRHRVRGCKCAAGMFPPWHSARVSPPRLKRRLAELPNGSAQQGYVQPRVGGRDAGTGRLKQGPLIARARGSVSAVAS